LELLFSAIGAEKQGGFQFFVFRARTDSLV